MTFVKKGVVIPVGSSGDVDDTHAYQPSVIKVNDKFYCYYAGDDVTTTRACLAISKDGFNFTKKGVVIPVGDLGDVDDTHAYQPSVIKVNDKFYCYYSANDGATARICLAISKDGF